MFFPISLLASLGVAAAYTWPNPQIDELEKLLYEQGGSGLNTPVFGVADCTTLPTDEPAKGRTNSAEWFRNAYHDMATANVLEGTGGLDASISFETDRAENPGLAFAESLNFFIPFQSVRSSMADIIALGAIVALGACSNGGVIVPFRGGRIDATGPGVTGVPEPQQDIDSHIGSFQNQGFNITEMVGLVACGHTLGGVHGNDFPEIVDVTEDPTVDDNRQDFDSTFAVFDNSVARQFVNNETQNPLAFGHNETTRSDARIFNADGGVMIRKMAEDNDFFLATCTSLVERMLNTVPKEVQLTDPIQPVPVKPDALSIKINPEDATMTISGKVRVLNDGQTSEQRQVFIDFTPRGGESGAIYSAQATRQTGANTFEGAYPGIPSFIVYGFTARVPVATSVSSFTVRLQDGETTIVGDNGGSGFPFPDTVLPQLDRSCLTLGANRLRIMNLTVAVRDDFQASDVILSVPWPVPQDGSIVPRFDFSNTTMTKTQSLNGTGYSLYNAVFSRTGSDTISIMKSLTYDVIGLAAGESQVSVFNKWNDFRGSSCAA